MTILSDSEIEILARRKKMIDPFINSMVNEESDGRKVLSYGLGSYGYDIRLSDKEFYLFTPGPDGTVDAKSFDRDKVLRPVELLNNEDGSQFFYMPPHSYALGVSKEKITLPSDVMVVAHGKNTYALSGIVVSTSPAESCWSGYLTIAVSNATPTYNKVYANEGIAQLLFFKGSACKVTYKDRKGKYINESEEVVFSTL